MNRQGIGVFYGVGVGPGDPELITRKAERVLKEVDWIFHPSGSPNGSFVRRIVEPLGLPAEKFRAVSLCMSRDRSADVSVYHLVATEIGQELHVGKSVAWITEGDPLFYSTFLNLHEALEADPAVRIEIVPGVTSVNASAARAGWTIARLHDRVAVVPAVYGIERLAAYLDDFATVFLLKVNSVFDRLLALLPRLGPSIRAVYLESVGTPAERIVTDLESLRGQELPYFSLVMLRRGEDRP
jgi:precorrin-2/cobalt-factor-2 C20-methyltransferase